MTRTQHVPIVSIGNSAVSSEIWRKKHAQVSFQRRSKLHESEGLVQFEVFEKLTSVFFPNCNEKLYILEVTIASLWAGYR
jgi:hypothetical protein